MGVQVELPTQAELAMERTFMAQERTFMAWLRTSMAMISFGFSVHEFFEYLIAHEGRHPRSPFGPRTYGIAMVVTGQLMLIVASLQHRAALHRFQREGAPVPFSWALLFASILLILGFLALLSTVRSVIERSA